MRVVFKDDLDPGTKGAALITGDEEVLLRKQRVISSKVDRLDQLWVDLEKR